MNLNYTLAASAIDYCVKQAGIRTVLSSAKFLEKTELKLNTKVVALEDLKDKVSKVDKLVAFVQGVLLPQFLLSAVLGLNRVRPDDLLTIIFTSGSTGHPKGVMLSHANISHNVEAIRRAVQLTEDDVVLGILPFFHSFGYSVTLWGVMTLGRAASITSTHWMRDKLVNLPNGTARPSCWVRPLSCAVTCAALNRSSSRS